MPREIEPVDSNVPCIGLENPQDHIDGRALPRPVRPEKPDDLTAIHGERNVIDRDGSAVTFAQTGYRKNRSHRSHESLHYRRSAISGGTRRWSQCRSDRASDLHISPTSALRTPCDSTPSIFGPRRAPRSSG